MDVRNCFILFAVILFAVTLLPGQEVSAQCSGPMPYTPWPVIRQTDNTCGAVTLTAAPEDGIPPEGVTWLWQGTDPNGTNTGYDYTIPYPANATGTYYIRALSSGGCWSTLSLGYTVTVNNPTTPPTPLVSGGTCGPKTLSFNGTPPAGTTWYWQTSLSGTSTASSSPTLSLGNQGTYTYYLRSRAGTCWGSASNGVTVVVDNNPQTPWPVIRESSTGNCGARILTAAPEDGIPPTGVTWLWQGTDPNGTNTGYDYTTSYPANASGTYYIRALSSGGCWSPLSLGYTVTVNNPTTPPAPIASTNTCGPKTLSFNGTPPAGTSWYWQVSINGTATISNNPTFILNDAGSYTYYLRAYAGGCWSSASNGITVVVDNPHAPWPVVRESNAICGFTTLTAAPEDGIPPTGVTWHWQGRDANGTNNNYEYTNPYYADLTGTYYIRALSNGGCWSTSSLAYAVTVKQLPVAEISPVGSKKICSTCSQNITVTTVPDNSYTYTWLKNGSPIQNATDSYYWAAEAGNYSVTVKLGDCTKTSNALALSRNIKPMANAGPDQVFELPFHNVVLHGSGTDADGTIVSYQWKKVTGPLMTMTGALSPDLSLSLAEEGTYEFQLVVTDDFGEESYPDLVTVTITSPNNQYNWIKETTMLVKDQFTDDDVRQAEIASGKKSITWRYMDGFGRPMQTVEVQRSPLKKDVVQPIIYDDRGREGTRYLPYASTEESGFYKKDPVNNEDTYTTSEQYLFYQTSDKVAHDEKPYARTVFEPSPLDRVFKQGEAGTAWQPAGDASDHSVNYSYKSNVEGEVLMIRYDATADRALIYSTYPPNKLYVTKKTDEHKHEVIEYVDKKGKIICKKVEYGIDKVDNTTKLYAATYYIYDEYDNMILVLPPEAIEALQRITD